MTDHPDRPDRPPFPTPGRPAPDAPSHPNYPAPQGPPATDPRPGRPPSPITPGGAAPPAPGRDPVPPRYDPGHPPPPDSGIPQPQPQPQPPPAPWPPSTGPAHDPDRQDRPWWGIGDIFLGGLFIVGAVVIGLVAGLIVAGDQALDVVDSGDTAAVPVAFLAVSLLFQQLGQGLWPFVVSRWKGLGPKSDWGLAIKPIDLGIGLGTAMIGLAAAAAAGLVVSELVDLTDEASADNTQFLTDAEGTPWLYLILFLVVIGAPVSEELLFRGLALRAIEKRAGTAIAVVASSIIFTLPHFIGSDWRGTLVLFASIFAVGLVLAVAAVTTRRLGAPIVAHMIFNAVGAAGALGWFDGLGV